MTQQLLSAGRSSVFRLINIDYGFYFYVVSLVFLLPLPWLLSSLTAAVLHELGHLAAAKCMKLEIHGIRLEVGGARIICEPPNNTQSLITAIAGPIVGFLLCFLFPYFPKIAFCGFLQSMFNLIPIIPFDGGRILLSVCNKLLGQERGERIYHYLSICFLIIAGILLYAKFHTVWLWFIICIPAVLGFLGHKKKLLAMRL